MVQLYILVATSMAGNRGQVSPTEQQYGYAVKLNTFRKKGAQSWSQHKKWLLQESITWKFNSKDRSSHQSLRKFVGLLE